MPHRTSRRALVAAALTAPVAGYLVPTRAQEVTPVASDREDEMSEPTETESIESLDHFIGVMRQIAQEAAETPEVVQQAPHTTEYKRLDEVGANRHLNLRWTPERAPEPVAAD